MSATQTDLNDFQNNAEINRSETTETVRVKDVMPTFTDWQNHPSNPDNN